MRSYISCPFSRLFFTRFCALTVCEMEPCIFGKCELTPNAFKVSTFAKFMRPSCRNEIQIELFIRNVASFRLRVCFSVLFIFFLQCHCLQGYVGRLCDQKQKPCADNPCESRGECFEKNGKFHCRCHAWWEGPRCERRMMRIPYKPLSERMLQEPFWLGLITVFVVLAFIGLVWCAKRHFPEKIEKLLTEEADRNRRKCDLTQARFRRKSEIYRQFPFPILAHGSLHHLHNHHHPSLREQLQFTITNSAPQSTATTPGTARTTIFGRLGIRKPSILSLSSQYAPNGGATARTFSLDDLLRPPPRRKPDRKYYFHLANQTKKQKAKTKAKQIQR